MDQEIWIPSKEDIQAMLTKDCIAHLSKASDNGEVVAQAFITWVNANAGVLFWIGEARREQLILDIAIACGLE